MTVWLLTWLWQGLTLTIATSAVFRMLPLNAATRYWIWFANLGAMSSTGALGAIGAAGARDALGLPAEALAANAGATRPYLFEVPAAPEAALAIFVGVWLAVALVLLVRIVPSVHAVFRLRDRCREFPPAVEAQLPLWREAQRRRSGRATRLMLCDTLDCATMLGFHRPYIAVPSSLLNALTRDELDQVVLHEHAHAQRWDDWTRLVQALLQSALWMHPAIAIINRRLNLEREIACDEWVVASSGLPKLYARCLMRAAEVRNRVSMQLLLGPALFTRRCDLILRVNRLLATSGRRRRNASVAGLIAGVCAVGIFTAQLRAIPLLGETSDVESLTVRLSAVARWNQLSSGETRRRAGEGGKLDSTYDPAETPLVRQESTNLRTDEPTKRRTNEPTNQRTNEPTNERTNEPTNPRTFEPSNQRTYEPPNAALARIAPDLTPIEARSIDGRYVASQLSSVPTERRASLRPFAALGTGVGGTARKASTGIASTFTRAGVSFARRF